MAAMAGFGAEAAWREACVAAALAVDTDAVPATSILPSDAIKTLEAGRALVVPNWLSREETAALRDDNAACFDAGKFKTFASSYVPSQAKGSMQMMSSFSGGKDGFFVDPTLGDFALRQRFKARMAEVKAVLASQLKGRPSLADDIKQTHEVQYIRYEAGAQLGRHTDEHHVSAKWLCQVAVPRDPSRASCCGSLLTGARSLHALGRLTHSFEIPPPAGRTQAALRLQAAQEARCHPPLDHVARLPEQAPKASNPRGPRLSL